MKSNITAAKLEPEAVAQGYLTRRAVHVPTRCTAAEDRHAGPSNRPGCDSRVSAFSIASDPQHGGIAFQPIRGTYLAFGIGIESVPFRGGAVWVGAHGAIHGSVVDNRTAIEVLRCTAWGVKVVLGNVG